MSRCLATRMVQICILVWFCYQSVFFALHSPPGFPLDEMYHLQLIDDHKKTDAFFALSETMLPSPLIEPHFSTYDRAAAYPVLYHALLGKLCRFFGLNVYDASTVILIRLLSVVMALASLILFVSWMRRVTRCETIVSFALLLHTSLLIVPYLSASVTYDVPMFLCCVLMLHELLHLREGMTLRHGVRFLLYGMLAMLMKILAVPFVLLLMLYLSIHYYRSSNGSSVLGALHAGKSEIVIAPILTLTTILVAAHYGGMFLTYGTPLPACADLFSHELCAQNYWSQQAANVEPPVEGALLGPLAYFLKWSEISLDRTVGIHSKVTIVHTGFLAKAILVVFVLALVSAVLFAKNVVLRSHLFISLCFALTVCFYWNYPSYLHRQSLGPGINGRYLLPVLPIIVGGIAVGILHFFTGRRRLLVASFCSFFVVLFSFPMLVQSPAFTELTKVPDVETYVSFPYGSPVAYDEAWDVIHLEHTQP